MTARKLYEAILIELNKENAPNITLEAFNYLANKAVRQYVNKRYNIYDINQQTTDDLGTLKSTAILTPKKVSDIYTGFSQTTGATYEVKLPSDYFHILNCICIYNVKKTYECYDQGYPYRAAAKRLTADMYSQVIDNYWNQPKYYRPYYYIHEVNTHSDNPYDDQTGTIFTKHGDKDFGSDGNNNQIITAFGPSRTIKIRNDNPPENTDENQRPLDIIEDDITDDTSNNSSENTNNSSENTDSKYYQASYVQRGAGIRYGNNREVRCEIRYGTDDSVFKLEKVYIDYIKVPQEIRLTQYQIDRTEDVSQVLDYPDYVCQEIVNELVHIVMENISDQRIQTHPVVSQSIANPTQQQTPEQQS